MTDLPRCRAGGLMTRHLADETLIYDLADHRAIRLTGLAVALWPLCDGTRDVAALMRDAGADDGASVRRALQQLSDAGLMENGGDDLADAVEAPFDPGRRAAMRKLVAGAAIIAPMVTVMNVPTAAQAASCTGFGGGCSISAECCPGLSCEGGRCGPPG